MKRILAILFFFIINSYCFSQANGGFIQRSNDSNSDQYMQLLISASEYDQVNENEKAMESLTQAIKLSPNEGLAYSQRGHLRLKIKDNKGAIEDFTKYIELSSGDPKAFGYLNRGRAKMELEDYTSALDDFSKSLLNKPDLGYTCYFQGLTYLKLNNKEKACESFTMGKKNKDKDCKKALRKYCK
ncbi:MAG: hypothetical protein AB9846_10355 [Tenuifilaceae bacterium]